jgi:glycerol-3-phosphate acyltransferase PlsY
MSATLILFGYAIGSIPFAFLLARRMAGVDVRRLGSRNVGAANVLRTTRPSLGLAVALLDLAKGSAVVLVAQRLGADEPLRTATGLAAILGHMFPVWLRFHGGKGVATACGVFSVLAPVATAVAGLAFLAVVWITRYISLGSVIATVLMGPLAYLTHAPEPVVLGALLMSTVIVLRHRGNLARLQAGTERRVGQRW